MTFQPVVPPHALRSSLLPRALQPRLGVALVSVLGLSSALPACAEAVPVSADELIQMRTDEALAGGGSAAPGITANADDVSAAADGVSGGAAVTAPTASGSAPAVTPPAEGPRLVAVANASDEESEAPRQAETDPVGTPVAEVPAGASGTPVPAPTMRTSGRRLLDACGEVFVTRGVEQIFGNQLPEGNDWVGLLQQIGASGVNAVRILAGTNTLGVEDVDALLDAVARHGMVAYVTPYGSEAGNWLSRPEVKAMLAEHERYILIDAFGEPTFDDRERFVADATASLRRVRDWGYRVPLTVTANQFGRDLPSILELGEQIIGADPLHNTVMGWQAYWGSTGYYQQTYGMSLSEGVQAAAAAPFPVQLGLDRITDFPSDVTADFESLMSATEANGIGWLWWDWYNPYGNENNLTRDGSAANLTETGRTVITSHSASVSNTARRACSGS